MFETSVAVQMTANTLWRKGDHGDDGFGGVERNFDAIILHLDLGRATDADEFNQLRETDGPP
jgi:hypothetical protein